MFAGLVRLPLSILLNSQNFYRGPCHSSPQRLKSREEHIEDLKATEYDIVIIGAGATGSGLAVECATRGLKAALIEANDFGSGTSSKSTKLIHGGIRYLEAVFKNMDPAQLKLVVEGLRERSHMRMAGGNLLTKAVGMFIPQKNIIDASVTAIGVKVYQFLAKVSTPGGFVMIPDSIIMRKEMASHLVNCAKRWRRSLLFFDGAHIDHRTVLHLINTASMGGYIPSMVPANVANHLPVVNMNIDSSGTVMSVVVKDALTGASFPVRGKVFINCTGPFTDQVRTIAGKQDKYIGSASGIHLSFPKRILNEHGGNTGILIPKTSKGSVCFVLPYQDYVIAGTTDVKEPACLSPEVSQADVQYLCQEISESIGVSAEELEKSVLSCWKGFRPLVVPPSTDSVKSSKVVRSHLLTREHSNFYSMMGGKWTSYRAMGQDAIDSIMDMQKGLLGRHKPCALAYDGAHADALKQKTAPSQSYGMKWSAACLTERLKNAHFNGLESSEDIGGFAGLLARQFDIEQTTAQRMMRTYGYFAWDLLLSGQTKGTNTPLHNIPFESRILASEVEWFCDREQGRSVDDVVTRRLGLSFLDSRTAAACIPEVALIMKRHLGWSTSRTTDEIRDCAREVKKMTYHSIPTLNQLAK
eukprot:GHVH01011001.1.p1 GENE.GHVH01011001.1~~GHVH01011001.1.p1  ORF type:complete len:640 (+),score=107.82 GHVH01011001.1:54-1973(+)